MEYIINKIQQDQFIATYNSDTARRHARYSLDWFEYWIKSSVVFSQITQDNIYQVLQGFVKFLEGQKAINEDCKIKIYDPGTIADPFASVTVKAYMGYLRTYLAQLGIKTDDREYRRLVRFQKPLHELKYTPDLSMVQRVIYGITPKYQNYLVLLLATGARQSEAIQLKVEDVDLSQTPASVHFPAHITKTRTERYSFLTKEAAGFIKNQIAGKQPGDLIFSDLKLGTFRAVWRDLRHRLGFEARYSTGVHKLTPHRLRAYTNRIIQRESGDAFADVILGHADGLQSYDVGSLETMRQDYAKAESMLTISPELRNFSQKNTTDRMQAEIDRLKFEIERLKTVV